MKHQLKLLALCVGMGVTLPNASAYSQEPIQVAFKYDASAPASETYRRAERTASKACGLNGRVIPIKRALMRSCVRPLVEQFVITTGNTDLIAHHEKRTGRKAGSFSFVAK